MSSIVVLRQEIFKTKQYFKDNLIFNIYYFICVKTVYFNSLYSRSLLVHEGGYVAVVIATTNIPSTITVTSEKEVVVESTTGNDNCI